MMQEQNCEPLPPRETAVLRTLFKWVHCIEFKMHDHLCLVGDVTGMVNEDLRHRHESFHMSPRSRARAQVFWGRQETDPLGLAASV